MASFLWNNIFKKLYKFFPTQDGKEEDQEEEHLFLRRYSSSSEVTLDQVSVNVESIVSRPTGKTFLRATSKLASSLWFKKSESPLHCQLPPNSATQVASKLVSLCLSTPSERIRTFADDPPKLAPLETPEDSSLPDDDQIPITTAPSLCLSSDIDNYISNVSRPPSSVTLTPRISPTNFCLSSSSSRARTLGARFPVPTSSFRLGFPELHNWTSPYPSSELFPVPEETMGHCDFAFAATESVTSPIPSSKVHGQKSQTLSAIGGGPPGQSFSCTCRSKRDRGTNTFHGRFTQGFSKDTVRPSHVARLIEEALGDLYTPFSNVKNVLVRQARDVLLCRYQGHYQSFQRGFLTPAKNLLEELTRKVRCCEARNGDEVAKWLGGRTCCGQSSGWPLCAGDGVLVHLCELEEAHLRPGDAYLFLSQCPAEGVRLVLRSCLKQRRVRDRVLDSMDLSDDQLSSVLRHLLVSVERGVERLDWERDLRTSSWQCRRGSAPDTRDCSVQTTSTPTPEEGSSHHVLLDENVVQDETPSQSELNSFDRRKLELQLSGSLEEEDEDLGYWESVPVSYPSSLSQLDQDILHSQLAILPGCRDYEGRSLVVVKLRALVSQDGLTATQLAQVFLYFHAVPKKEVSSKGLTFLLDGRNAESSGWPLIEESLALLQATSPGSLHRVLVWQGAAEHLESLGSANKWEHLRDEKELLKHVSREQLLPDYGGTYMFDNQEWISFRKFLDPFVAACRLSGRRLVNVMHELKGGRLPGSAQLTAHMMEQQKRHLNMCIFQDEHLGHLQDEGDTILRELKAYGDRAPHNPDYRESLERCSNLYGELRRAMSQLTKLADKRLIRLEKCLHLKTLAEETSQVLWWLRRRGEEALAKHKAIEDSLEGIKQQEEDFEKFYFLAMRQIEKGNDLLEEAAAVLPADQNPLTEHKNIPASVTDGSPDQGPEGMKALAVSLRFQLDAFTERLEETRERVEDLSKCYHLLDKVYEWALETMYFVGEMQVEPSSSPEQLAAMTKSLDDYLDAHPPIAEEVFDEMLELASNHSKDILLESCKKAQSKCQEAVELVGARQTTLLKARQQMDLEASVRAWEDERVASPVELRPRPDFWSPPSASTPCTIFGGRRRASVGSPFGSCTAFPSNAFPVSSLQESLRLDRYLQEKEEQLQSRGLITEDLTPQGPVTSLGPLRAGLSAECPLGRSSSGSRLTTRGGATSLSSQQQQHRPSKKAMRMCPTWQLCEEALDKAAAQVRDQNKRLLEEGLSSKDVTDRLVYTDEGSREEQQVPRVTLNEEEDLKSPVSVNSHLSVRRIEDCSTEDQTPEMERHKRTLLLVMRELTQTERDYVKSLEYIIDNYVPELSREDIPQALRGKRNVIFGNIEKIFEFHSQYFLNELERCEDSPFLVGQCFLQYERQFYLYALYNKNKPKSDSLMSEYGTAFFRKKQLDLKDKMDLASYMLKPVQRMGKYALLLKQILKECPETEKESEFEDLKAAEEMVRFQLRHGNDLLAMDALRDCDVNVKEQGRLMRQDEFLVWQGRYRKSLRRVFLFEDLILFSKARRDPDNKGQEIYQYKLSIKTTDVGFTEQIGDSPTKFEIWFRKRKLHDTYILQAQSSEVKTAWAHEISRLLWRQALKNREIRLAEMSSMGFGSKPCLDIKPSVDQISTRSINLSLPRAPRYRNSIAVSSLDQLRNNKRPHSIISVSSSSSSGSSGGGGVSFNFYGALNLGFEPGDSPRPHHRSITQQSQCSTESGFCTDVSLAGDSPEEKQHKKVERTDSVLSNESTVTHLPATECLQHRDDPTADHQQTPL